MAAFRFKTASLETRCWCRGRTKKNQHIKPKKNGPKVHSKRFSRECDSARLSLSVSSPQNKMLSSGRQICSRLLRPVCCSRKRKKKYRNVPEICLRVAASVPPGSGVVSTHSSFSFLFFFTGFWGFFFCWAFIRFFFWLGLTGSSIGFQGYHLVFLGPILDWAGLSLFPRVLLGFNGFC